MIRFFLIIVTFAFAVLSTAALAETNATGKWNINAASGQSLAGRITLNQQGQTVVGNWPNGSLHGNINAENSHQVDAKWDSPKGNGWATIIFGNDWKTFSGQWGYPGKKPTGSFVAQRFYQSYPPVSNLWSVNRTGGEVFVNGNVNLQQQGTTVIGNYSNKTGQINGAFNTPGVNEMQGTWKDKRGSGWIDLAFSEDSKKFSGSWGNSGSSTARGNLVGTINTIVSPITTGKWKITLTGQDTHSMTVQFKQEGQSIIATWEKGRITGTLPQGSYILDGTWQTKAGYGPVELTFDPGGNSFNGFWGYPGKPSRGRVLGQRIK